MLLGCDNAANPRPVGCPYVLNLALLSPSSPRLHIGDTLTMHVKTWAPVGAECLPPDTTAAGLRWSTADGVVVIDSLTGHVTALRPGGAFIYLAQVGVFDAALGSTDAYVFEPATADSVVTIIRNSTGDSAFVVLEDATGAAQKWQTVVPRDSTCWVTRLSDSVRYSVTIRPAPQPPGSDSSTVRWITHSALAFNRTWVIVVDSITSPNATVTVGLFAPDPDPGKGC